MSDMVENNESSETYIDYTENTCLSSTTNNIEPER